MQSKEIIEKIGKRIDAANNILLLGWVYNQKGDIKSSLNFGMKSVELYQKLNAQVGLSSSLYLVGSSHYANNNYGLAIKFFEKALSIKEILPVEKAGILHMLASIYVMKGDLSKSLKYSEKGVKYAKQGKFYYRYGMCMILLAEIYGFMGDYDRAIDYIKKSLKISEKYGIDIAKAFSLFFLILVYYQIDSYEQTQEYLDQLKEFETHTDNKIITHAYLIGKGFSLKNSNNAKDHTEAELLFKQVIEDEIHQIDLYALFFLCDLLLEKLGTTNDLKIIDEIYPLIFKLLNLAEKIESYMFLTEVKIFQAKVELVQMNFNEAKLLLTQAQQIAELHNIQVLAQFASSEHDKLLEQQDKWEKLNKTNAPIAERIRLASFDGILDRIQGRRSEEPPELVTEVPVFLLIITESGVPLFSHSFSRELSFEDDIISSFISAFNSFSGELFSKGLDRARFGDYTILMESVDSYSVCYLFKGQTYPAKQKLSNFVEEMQRNSTIWQNLNKFYKTSQVAEIKDLPQIQELLNEIFLE